MSIPDWTYDEKYYAALTASTGLEIRTDPVKGKGLFATKAFEEGDRVLTETALCCTQNVDEVLRQAPCCANCLVSLESPIRIVTRATGNKSLGAELPNVTHFRPRTRIYCRNREQGCSFMFCGPRCADAAWKTYHFVGCVGNMSKAQRSEYSDFINAAWEQGGVDYSDTHFFAWRFLCQTLSRHRLEGLPLPQAFAPVAQLIRAPLKKFTFSFLLGDDETAEAKYASFLHHLDDPAQHPAVVEASKDLSKETMVGRGLAAVKTILAFTPEEELFFNLDRWSETLGAVLLNGQERTPNSPFTEYAEWLQNFPDGEATYKALKKKLGGSSVVNKCHTSSKGQGIYTIGACFNHSCDPNLQVLYTERNDETLVAVCIKPIAAGEECSISYINEEMVFFERHQQLFEHYLFTCTCDKCENDRKQGNIGIAAKTKENEVKEEKQEGGQDEGKEHPDQERPAAPTSTESPKKPVEEDAPEDSGAATSSKDTTATSTDTPPKEKEKKETHVDPSASVDDKGEEGEKEVPLSTTSTEGTAEQPSANSDSPTKKEN